MSAAEIIELIKQLPVSERAKVEAFVRSAESGTDAANTGVRTLDAATFDRAKAAVFQKHDEVLRRLAQ